MVIEANICGVTACLSTSCTPRKDSLLSVVKTTAIFQCTNGYEYQSKSTFLRYLHCLCFFCYNICVWEEPINEGIKLCPAHSHGIAHHASQSFFLR